MLLTAAGQARGDGSAVLLMLFALAMFSGNPKSPFDYSVFTAASALCALAAVWSETMKSILIMLCLR